MDCARHPQPEDREPPGQIGSHPSGSPCKDDPFETWTCRRFELGQPVIQMFLTFVGKEYRLASNSGVRIYCWVPPNSLPTQTLVAPVSCLGLQHSRLMLWMPSRCGFQASPAADWHEAPVCATRLCLKLRPPPNTATCSADPAFCVGLRLSAN